MKNQRYMLNNIKVKLINELFELNISYRIIYVGIFHYLYLLFQFVL